MLDDVGRHLRSVRERPWPPAWFGAGKAPPMMSPPGPAPVRDLRPYREGWLAGRVREGIGAAVVILLSLNMFCAALTIASSDEG